jgi:DNA-binding HxlR family transcriptional regulator
MDIFDQHIAQKEKELTDLLARINDPQLQRLLADLEALRRSREILRSSAPFQAVREVHQRPQSDKPATKGDAAVLIIQKAGRPLHVDKILAEMPSYGFRGVKKVNMVSNMIKDRRSRFHNIGGNVYALRDNAVISRAETNGHRPQSQFSLTTALNDLLPGLRGEFSQPIIYTALKRLFPEANIQKPSISSTLRNLESKGMIEITHKGFGPDPRRYRWKEVS